MHRTTGTDNVNGMFTDGDAEQGQLATVIDASWLNSVQEEIAALIEAGGVTLDATDNNQLKKLFTTLGVLALKVASVQIVGSNATATLTNGSLKVQGNSGYVEITQNEVIVNGTKLHMETNSGVAVMHSDNVLECDSNLIVDGSTSMLGNASVAGSLSINGLTVQKVTESQASILQVSAILKTLYAFYCNSLDVTGAANIGGAAYITGNTVCNGPMLIKNKVILSNASGVIPQGVTASSPICYVNGDTNLVTSTESFTIGQEITIYNPNATTVKVYFDGSLYVEIETKCCCKFVCISPSSGANTFSALKTA